MASFDLELFSPWIFFFLSKFSKLQNDEHISLDQVQSTCMLKPVSHQLYNCLSVQFSLGDRPCRHISRSQTNLQMPHVDQHQTQGSSTMLAPCGSTPNTRQQYNARPMWINTKHKAAVRYSPHVDQHQTQDSITMLAPCGSAPNIRQQYDAHPMWINTKNKAAVLCSPHVNHQTQGCSTMLPL